MQCSRRLPQRRFTQRNDVCDTCLRKTQHPLVRTAVGRIVEEHDMPIAGNDGDLHVFMDEQEDTVMQLLEEAVNRHR